MKVEIEALKKTNTWDLAKFPRGKKVIDVDESL